MTGSPRPLNLFVCVAIGLGAAVVGLLPWLLTGLRLPLQNLWAAVVTPDAMPVVLLPFSQYSLTLVTGLLVAGAALGGGVARLLRRRMPRGGVLAIAGGVAFLQVVALAQTSAVVLGGLRQDLESRLYFFAVFGAAALSFLLGMLTLWLIARAPRPGATIGLALAALAAQQWTAAMIVPPFAVSPSEVQIWLLGASRWLPAVIVGVAIAWCGVRTVGRALAGAGALVILWVAPAATSAISMAAGSRVYARFPGEMVAVAGQVFVSALGVPSLVLMPVLLAVAIAATGLVARRSVRVSRAVAAAPPSP